VIARVIAFAEEQTAPPQTFFTTQDTYLHAICLYFLSRLHCKRITGIANNITQVSRQTSYLQLPKWARGDTVRLRVRSTSFIQIDVSPGLFQSDHDFDIVDELASEAGVSQLQKEAQAKLKAEGRDKEADDIYYSINSYACSDPKLVRKHLDSGVLAKLIADKEAKLLTIPEKHEWHDPCYIYVLLGVCAMTLGCQLPESYISMLKKVYREGGLMPVALKQMKKALFGPDGFENGVPYDFEVKSFEQMAMETDRKPGSSGIISMNVIGPGGIFNTGMGDSTTSKIIKELRDKHNNPDLCGGCGLKAGEEGTVLMRCGQCKDRKYCSSDCQKKSWKVHKKVCDPAQR
jgi:hypothetical protein